MSEPDSSGRPVQEPKILTFREVLPFPAIESICQHLYLQSDLRSLHRLALVSSEFEQVSSSFIWRRLCICRTEEQGTGQDVSLREFDERILRICQSSRRVASLVRHLTISLQRDEDDPSTTQTTLCRAFAQLLDSTDNLRELTFERQGLQQGIESLNDLRTAGNLNETSARDSLEWRFPIDPYLLSSILNRHGLKEITLSGLRLSDPQSLHAATITPNRHLPNLESISFYECKASIIQLLAWDFPRLRHVKVDAWENDSGYPIFLSRNEEGWKRLRSLGMKGFNTPRDMHVLYKSLETYRSKSEIFALARLFIEIRSLTRGELSAFLWGFRSPTLEDLTIRAISVREVNEHLTEEIADAFPGLRYLVLRCRNQAAPFIDFFPPSVLSKLSKIRVIGLGLGLIGNGFVGLIDRLDQLDRQRRNPGGGQLIRRSPSVGTLFRNRRREDGQEREGVWGRGFKQKIRGIFEYAFEAFASLEAVLLYSIEFNMYPELGVLRRGVNGVGEGMEEVESDENPWTGLVAGPLFLVEGTKNRDISMAVDMWGDRPFNADRSTGELG